MVASKERSSRALPSRGRWVFIRSFFVIHFFISSTRSFTNMLLRPTSCFQFFLFLYTIVSLANAATKPNIVLIIADDQDVRTGTLDYMPKLQAAIAQQGITFDRFYAPVSQCCPSRVSLLTAQYAHNHNVTYVEPPEGGTCTFFGCPLQRASHYDRNV